MSIKSVFPKDDKHMGNIDYFKLSSLEDGEEIRIRLITEGIVGWEDWTSDNRPVRFRPKEKPNDPLISGKPIREFFAVCIWNYEIERVQILSFTQKRVKNSLKKMEAKMGPLTGYDIRIVRNGEKEDTQYVFFACKATKIPEHALQSLELKPINLYALYEGKDPWKDLDAGRSEINSEFEEEEDPNDSDVA